MMLSTIPVHVNEWIIPTEAKLSRGGSAAAALLLRRPANGLLRTECPCAQAHTAPRTLESSSEERLKRVRDCMHLQEASRCALEMPRIRAEHFGKDGTRIRDGECNKHGKQESYFCVGAAGGMGGVWLSI